MEDPENRASEESARNPLRWLFRLFRHRLSRYAGWLVGGTGIQALVGFGANLVLVRLLLPEEFGQFAVVQANVALASTFINFKVDDLVFRLSESDLDRVQMGLFGSALVVESLGITVAALVVLATLNLLSVGALLLLGATVSASWLSVETRLYERRFKYRNLSVIETVSHAVGHVAAVGGALLGWGAIVLYLREPVRRAGKVVGLAAVGGLQRIPIRKPSFDGWKQLYEQVRGFWADGFLAQGFERAVILVVAGLTGHRVTGYFFQARRLAVVPHQLLQPVTFRMAFNIFSRLESPEERQRVLDRGLATGCLLLTLGGAVSYLLADPVIPWLFGETWAPVVPLFRGMAGVLVGLTLFTTLQAYHMALGQMSHFVKIGRTAQYGAFALAAGAGTVNFVAAQDALAYGLSASFLVPTALLLVFPRVRRRVEE